MEYRPPRAGKVTSITHEIQTCFSIVISQWFMR
jgi:hypothetical protein